MEHMYLYLLIPTCIWFYLSWNFVIYVVRITLQPVYLCIECETINEYVICKVHFIEKKIYGWYYKQNFRL